MTNDLGSIDPESMSLKVVGEVRVIFPSPLDNVIDLVTKHECVTGINSFRDAIILFVQLVVVSALIS